MWRYYRDITAYNFALSGFVFIYQLINIGTLKSALVLSGMLFAVFGTGLGLLAYQYFQKQQYYMYYNLGFSKTYLISKTWGVNFGLGIFICLLANIIF